MDKVEPDKHECLQCGTTSDRRVLLSCEYKGRQHWVCVSCLPVLIHGAPG